MKQLAWLVVVLLLSSVVAAELPVSRETLDGAKLKTIYVSPRALDYASVDEYVDDKNFYYFKYDETKKEVTIIASDTEGAHPGYVSISASDARIAEAHIAPKDSSFVKSYEAPAVGGPSSSGGTGGSASEPRAYRVNAGENNDFQAAVDGDAVVLQVKTQVAVLDKKGKPTGEKKDAYVTFGKVSKKKLEEKYATTDIAALLKDKSFMTAAFLFRKQDIRIDEAQRIGNVYYYGGSSELFLQDAAVYTDKDGSVVYIEGDFEFDSNDQLLLEGDAPKYQKDDDYTIVTRDGDGNIVAIVDKDVAGLTTGSTLYAAVLIIDPVSHQPTYRVITQENDKVTSTAEYPFGSIPGTGVSGVQIYADAEGNRIYYELKTGTYYDKDGKELKDDSFIKPDQKDAVTKAKNVLAKDHGVRQSQNPTHLEYLGRLLSQGDFLTFIGDIFKGYQQWQGLGAYGGLFLGDQIKGWRANIDDAFCKVGIGIECKAEKLCEKFSSRSTGDNVVVTSSPSSGIKAAAYVQGERSAPAVFTDEKGTHEQYLYKVTYYAASPDSENAAQLTFKYGGGSYSWYPEPLKISKGGAVSAQGTGAIIAYSDKKYSEVCIELQNGIKTGSGTAHRACAPIVSSGVTPSGEIPEPAAEETTEAAPDQTTDESAPAEPPAVAGDGF